MKQLYPQFIPNSKIGVEYYRENRGARAAGVLFSAARRKLILHSFGPEKGEQFKQGLGKRPKPAREPLLISISEFIVPEVSISHHERRPRRT